MTHLVLVFLLLITHHLSAQGYHNISLGTTFTPLSTPNSWLSPYGNFAFGFRPLETNPTLFLLSIWFDKIGSKTVVWTANGDNPIADGSKVELTSSGQLSLKAPTGQEIWNAGVSKASHASMLDTGNFVLYSAGSDIIWQSFDHPTDTILPGQVLKQGARIYARILDSDYSPGRFELTLQEDGNLVLYPLAYPTKLEYGAFWSSATSGSGIRLIFNESGSIQLSFSNNSQYSVIPTLIPSDNYYLMSDNYYQRATLDPDGLFRQYSFLKNELTTGSWEVKGKIDLDICHAPFTNFGSGACGFNSYCTTDASGFVDCKCPFHYSFINPNRKYEGCAPDFAAQSCEMGGEAQFDFKPMDNTNWPSGDADQLSPMNETECRSNCLSDCLCAVAIYNDNNNGTCWKKKLPLSNGRTAEIGMAEIGMALIKYSMYNNSPPSTNTKRDWHIWVLVGSLLLGSSVVLNLVFVILHLYKRNQPNVPLSSSCMPGSAPCSFTYKELKEATKDFSEEIGRGAFGIVYKGILASEPKTLIAVKKLETLLEEAEKDFANEVTTIGQTHHKNLVQLLGFCKEGTDRLLVYEFMSNGSLNKLLFHSESPEWNQRVQIALGIAGGLAYLHEECRNQIIHCDIKPQNILLDDNYIARISDFGLAKLLPLEQTRTSTGIRGTIGYFAPEWFKIVAITAKVDVYSFGVMLLEIICCRRNFERGLESQHTITLIDGAKELYRNGRLALLVEEDEDAKKDLMTLERFVMVAISCIQEEPWLRPSMKQVVQMLEGAISVSIPPNMYSIRY